MKKTSKQIFQQIQETKLEIKQLESKLHSLIEKYGSYFEEGQKVTLLPFEDQPEQRGEILVIERGMVGIQLQAKYYKKRGQNFGENLDDGIRECLADQLKPL